MSQRKVLLIEPNYSNKYPPIGLMKMATYFRNRGDEVVFYKGDLKLFVIERITLRCIEECKVLAPEIDWDSFYPSIYTYIRTRKASSMDDVDYSSSPFNLILDAKS